MSIGRIIAIGGAYLLYRQGYFDALIALYAPSMSADLAQTEQPFFVDATGQFFPVEEEVQAPPMTTEERWLSDNWEYVQPWARRNRTWVAAMMWQESRGNPNATSSANARGLMQVIDGTMQWMFDSGFRAFPVQPRSLYQPDVSIYFGTAFLEYLSGLSSDREWITRAYNAGPGGERQDGTWPRETDAYFAAINRKYTSLMNR